MVESWLPSVGVDSAVPFAVPEPAWYAPPLARRPCRWGEDGMSALMAAAHRGGLGSLGALLAAGACRMGCAHA